MMASTTPAAAAKTVQPFTPNLFEEEGDVSHETELSPEPSPEVPPAPQQAYYHHSGKILGCSSAMKQSQVVAQQTHQPVDVITPRQTLVYDEKDDDDYHESELSLSDVVPAPPSPYSPPPSSLFSGEDDDFTPKAAASATIRNNNKDSQRRRRGRPPLQEVRLGSSSKELQDLSHRHHHHHHQLVPNDDNCESTDQRSVEGLLNHHHQLMDQEEEEEDHQLVVDLTTRSHNLLPAVLHLKQNLAESHQSFYLLQQENKALAAECDKVEAQLKYWQTAAAETTQATSEQQEALQETVNTLTQENQGLQEEKKALEDKIDSLTKVQEQLQETVQNTESLQQQVESLTLQCQEVSLSNQTLQEEKDRLSQQVLAAQARAGGAQAEQERLEQRLQELQSEIRSLSTKLKEVTATWSQRVDTMKQQHEEAQSCLVQENTSQRLEIDKCKAMLKEAERKHRKELQTATSTGNKAIISDLQNEMDRLDAALKESEASNSTLCAENKDLQCELQEQKRKQQQQQQQQQRDVVDAACQTDAPMKQQVVEASTQTAQNIPHDESDMQTSSSSSPEAAASTTTGIGMNHRVSIAAVESRSSNDNNITERLGRIRDAAERATWMQDYRREIARLKADHQTELRRLEEIHDENLRRVISEAKREMNTRTKEYKRSVKQEYAGRVASLERKQQEELKRTIQEYEAKVAATEQAMKEAVSELSLTTKQVERAVSERQDLDQRVAELERQLQEQEQKRTVDHEERKSLRKEWEDETDALLAAIREECNAVFDRRKQPTTRTSPRSVLIEPILESTSGLSQDDAITTTTQPAFVHRPQPRRRSTSVSSTPPPSTSCHSNLDQALDETEALVRKLLENEMNE